MKRLLAPVLTAVLAGLCCAAWADGSGSPPSFKIAVVPEPGTFAGFAAGLAALGLGRFLKK